jgi:hypothetical protein
MYTHDHIHKTDVMPDLETNFAIAIIGMTVFCIILVGVPLAFMLANSFMMRKRTKVPTR